MLKLFSTLIFLSCYLNAGWVSSLGNISNSQSVKKSYLRGLLSQKSYGAYKISKIFSRDKVLKLYEQNENRLYWFDDGQTINYKIIKLIDAIKSAANEGLDLQRYHYSELESLYKDMIGEVLIEEKDKNLAAINMDILLNDAFFTLISDLVYGQVDYNRFSKVLKSRSKKFDIDYKWVVAKKNLDIFELISAVKQKGDFETLIKDLISKNSIYVKLRGAYTNYKFIEDFGGFQKVEYGKTLRVGSKSNIVRDLSIRLNQSNDLQYYDQNNTLFDKNIKIALQKFQKRVGIYPSGILNSPTVKVLNIPVSKRLEQIKINLERSRWESDSFSYKYFFVNIPEFKMRFKDGDTTLLESRVIVGKKKNPTPIFKSDMSYVVLNPRWNVPNSIVVKEMLEKVKDDPFYFEDRDYKMYNGWSKDRKEIDAFEIDWFLYDENSTVPFSIVKKSGEKNPLGVVKFMFPNPHAVYMHDTPTKYLFKRPIRAFSHGCIRLQNPKKLLKFVTENYIDRSYADIKEVLDSGKNSSVNLNKKIPVYIKYYTAYVDNDGGVYFSNDIYGYDKIFKELLQNIN